ncbi:MAG TPA: FHA domain-containing protein [Thermoleophilaceae bacterium]|jgi:putative peptide zinc metalloprotease protein|nr:FHA domain-containing protein [Thermoleophilaceae bacterium]
MPVSFDLILPDGRRVPVGAGMTVGRAAAAVVLTDPSVSRSHARIAVAADGLWVEDLGSASGTWVDGIRIERATPLDDGAIVQLGNTSLVVERHRDESEAGRTAFSPVGASAALPAATPGPRLRSGYALKRLDASEGSRRWVLKNLRGGGFMRLSDADAALVALLDGQRSVAELALAAEQTAGPDGAVRLATLLADLSEKEMIVGAAAAEPGRPARGWRRLLVPRQTTWDGAGRFFSRLYRSIGRHAFTPTAFMVFAIVAGLGLAAFVYLVAGRYGTPFVVANKVGLGGLVFLVGRLAIATVHEAAHALTMERFGRHVGRAGVKLVLIFPYAFVDTSDAWFESRRRRLAVSAAGPISDFVLGGTFGLCALVLPAGTLRDICFQLAFAAYVGAIFNLNPFLQRDGYQLLVDYLRQPQLRARANEQLRRRLAGERGPHSPLLARYSEFRVAWLALAALFSVAMSLHYEARFAALVPPAVAWGVMAVLWVAFFVPVVLALRPVVVTRARERGT